MIIVSGCPRSGTSLMMNILRTALGDWRIVGRSGFEQPEPAGTELELAARKYAADAVKRFRRGMEESEDREVREVRARSMNPDGFWECPYTVDGVSFSMEDHARQLDLLENGKRKICKIVSQGLYATDPAFVDRVIFMARHPRAVAKSQERLERNLPFKKTKELRIHTPEMFINVTRAAARWLDRYKPPVLVVVYDELVDRPETALVEVSKFLTEQVVSGASVVKRDLRRSDPENVPSDLWTDAEEVYARLLKKDFAGIDAYMADPRLATNLRHRRWMCARRAQTVDCVDCARCRANPKAALLFRQYAEARGIMWKTEPCLYECGFSPFGEHITIERSIAENTWSGLC